MNRILLKIQVELFEKRNRACSKQGENVEKRHEERKKKKMVLELLHKKFRHVVRTTDISHNGCAVESSVHLPLSAGELLEVISSSREKTLNFRAMVRWYRRELDRNLFGFQIINPPAEWSMQSGTVKSSVRDQRAIPVFQLHFGNFDSLQEEYAMHLSRGFLEVSPTPQVPQLNANVAIDVFLPGQNEPDRISGKVLRHIAGGFNVRFTKPSSFIKKVEQLLNS